MRKPQGGLGYATRLQETPQSLDLTMHHLRLGLLPEAPNESHTGGLGSLLGWRRANRGGHEETATGVVPETTEPEATKMIDEIFEPLKPALEKLSELAKQLEPIARVQPLAEAFGPIRVFKDKVASVVEPIRKLEREFEQLADVFEPIRLIRDELVGITSALSSKLAQLTHVLEPLGELREELAALTAALEPANELHDDFNRLSIVITTTVNERGANT